MLEDMGALFDQAEDLLQLGDDRPNHLKKIVFPSDGSLFPDHVYRICVISGLVAPVRTMAGKVRPNSTTTVTRMTTCTVGNVFVKWQEQEVGEAIRSLKVRGNGFRWLHQSTGKISGWCVPAHT